MRIQQLSSAAPSRALVGIASPIDVVAATTGMLLWTAAVAVVLPARAVRTPRPEPEITAA